MLKNGISTINLRSTGGAQGAEGVRGGTYNDIFKDEYQSLIEEHLPVIDECAATFQGPDAPYQAYFCNTGTPLGFENPIEREWNQSKGWEWYIRCPHCGRFMEPLGMHNLDPDRDYLWCTQPACGRNVYRKKGTPRKFDPEAYDYQCPRIPPEGKWFATNPKGKFPGFRVVRMMMPWSVWRSDSGTGILDRLETWPERKFQNEVMGLPFDGGSQPFSESTLRACCTSPDRLPRTVSEEEMIAQKYLQYPKVAGLDWAGTGDESVAAYTTYGVFAVVNGRLRLIYAHKFVGLGSSDPDFILRHIVERMNRFQINLLMADYGMGHWEDRQRGWGSVCYARKRHQTAPPIRWPWRHRARGHTRGHTRPGPCACSWDSVITGSVIGGPFIGGLRRVADEPADVDEVAGVGEGGDVALLAPDDVQEVALRPRLTGPRGPQGERPLLLGVGLGAEPAVGAEREVVERREVRRGRGDRRHDAQGVACRRGARVGLIAVPRPRAAVVLDAGGLVRADEDVALHVAQVGLAVRRHRPEARQEVDVQARRPAHPRVEERAEVRVPEDPEVAGVGVAAVEPAYDLAEGPEEAVEPPEVVDRVPLAVPVQDEVEFGRRAAGGALRRRRAVEGIVAVLVRSSAGVGSSAVEAPSVSRESFARTCGRHDPLWR